VVDPYVIPGTNTLKNKLGITDSKTLDNYERSFSSVRESEMKLKPLKGKLDFDYLKNIHKKLFGDVYDWAGETRTVNISKDTGFAPVQNIDSFAKSVFTELEKENYLQGLDKEKFVDRAAHHLGEINALHPFRDGNGRSMRIFINEVANRAGYSFDFSKTNQKEMVSASIDSFHSMNPKKMKALLSKALIEPLKKKSARQNYNCFPKAIQMHTSLL